MVAALQTIRLHITTRRPPAVKLGQRYYVAPEDPDRVLPHMSEKDDESLKAWAKRLAADAPPFNEEQRSIIRTALRTSSNPKSKNTKEKPPRKKREIRDLHRRTKLKRIRYSTALSLTLVGRRTN